MFPRLMCLTSALALTAGIAQAERSFNRIAAFPVVQNMAAGEDTSRETSPEIIDATADGMTLVYTDSPLEALGLIDITDPTNPAPNGNIALPGEPTSVAVIGSTAYVGINTSESYTQPSGLLKSIDTKTGAETGSCDLGGQPDSIAKSKDGAFLAVAIENERDEDLNDGMLPQMPAGNLALVNTTQSGLDCASMKFVSLTGLADIAGEDPEPEYVSINGLGETVVTLQENNHLVIVSKDGEIVNHFSAGSVDLDEIDATDERGALIFNESQTGRLREPDAVTWVDDTHFATANEGDYTGGSRGWTIFNKDGSVVYDSGTSFEHAIVQIGHYPDKRSDAKGVEPESVTFAEFDGTPYVFVGAERASVVGVYDVSDLGNPVLTQLLPSGVGPEGYAVLPARNLLVSANEKDLIEDKGPRAHVMLYELQAGAPTYPHLTSEGADELIGWGALSGMVADAGGMIYAVNDSFYGFQPSIFKIDPSQTPARIVDVIRIHRQDGNPAQKLDLEGITLDGKGGFYVASEGRSDRVTPHAIYHVSKDGLIKAKKGEIGLPAELMAVEKRFGFEGITKVGDTLWMAVQREWKDDPKNHVKLVAYNLETKEWGAIHYPKAEPDTGWVGLSEIVAHGDYVYVIERDNQHDFRAVTKKVYRIPLAEMTPTPLGGDLPVVSKELVRDLLPDLTATGGYVLDKVEGLAITAEGEGFIVTDNDGVDDASGETMFFSIGQMNTQTVN
ncbi:esterase-like activity of phytase family protein [Phaeobacter gallaeciensis]|uniref:Esterase-like activity of phytase n=1 Tax=Phaeobacter gallaeciensis TaxID=60890 RepID=A0AAC9Z5G7_9RHOB|nr:esterase-like activity of phytase family protein [Phaeobacter gallaeciensis]AHD08257.1 Esterase-like activity of phytase [Phaeobacter gallaeciensis DSM 26640]ATE91523.1 Esterase-like activity of phytase [Phaeobacter gallaeciensis]ATE95799.1 Esterase-like activity of phytase [Phaeobacter gallaeciensis]ATF00139.1 Esterase-like activity of phytase [Phaeobacter gallaeciensis]ATF04571.1 Esterase-like activity of phytase [Phaeobacter gallaeciensis]